VRGRSLKLSIPRRIVIDLMHASRSNPGIPASRRMHLAPLVAARAAACVRMPWPAIFAKAFGLVAHEMPELRRVYLPYPWPRLYEFETSVANIVIERFFGDEPGVLAHMIKDPAGIDLAGIGARIRQVAQSPIQEIVDFRRMIAIARLPRPLRRCIWWIGLNIGRQRANYFGSFAISAVSGLGTDLLHVRAPFPVVLTYGVIDDAGALDVRIIFDHRSLDGAVVARTLRRLEELLLGPILSEILDLPRRGPTENCGGFQDEPGPSAASLTSVA
jgi:hypothetical protein